MSHKILLDTNAYSALTRGDIAVLGALATTRRVYMSVIVLAELYYGFKNGNQEQKNRQLLTRFLQRPSVRILHVTTETADICAGLMLHLKQTGNKIPINDVWIAAHTLETGARLYSYDRHFQHIPNLRLHTH